MSSYDRVGCYNCNKEEDGGPICRSCWRKLDKDQRENIKSNYNDQVYDEIKNGHDVQPFCDMPDCWGLVKRSQLLMARLGAMSISRLLIILNVIVRGRRST